MKIAVLFYDQMTSLDAIGPIDVLGRIPGAEIVTVGLQAGTVRTEDTGIGLVVDRSIDEVPEADLLLIPGGFGTRALMHDQRLIEWVRRVDKGTRWTASVCTGALILGAAGLLKGKRATTYWSVHDRLAELGATPVRERYVFDGTVVTSAGVSAGIDMALALVGRILGDQAAQAIQLGIEYDPQPPYDAGSPDKAPPALVEMIKGALARREES